MTPGTLPPCPGCGKVLTWSSPVAGSLRFGCACHAAVFDITTASADDVAALKLVVEQICLEEWHKIMDRAVMLEPRSGVRQ